MKTKLLTSIAAAALIAGSGAVFAQGSGQEKSPGMSQGGSTGGMSQGGASQSAPAEKMSPGTTGQGSQSAPKAGQSADDMKSKSGSTAKDDDKSKSSTTGQGAKDKAGSTAKDDDKSKSGSSAKSDDDKAKSGSTAQGKDKDKAGSTTGQGAAGSSASLTTEQKTKISTTIKQQNVKPATNVNFNVSVGTVVPRSVELHTLPASVIEVYPAWRGYRFILVGDEIVIIDPATYRIVTVIVV